MADYYWNGASNALWGTASNWRVGSQSGSTPAVPPQPNDVVYFTRQLTADNNARADVSLGNIAKIVYSDSDPVSGRQYIGGSALATPGTTWALTTNSIIDVLSYPTTASGTATLNYLNGISGSGRISKTGPGLLALTYNGDMSGWTGGFDLAAGIIYLGVLPTNWNKFGAGTNPLEVTGGALYAGDSSAATISAPVKLSGASWYINQIPPETSGGFPAITKVACTFSGGFVLNFASSTNIYCGTNVTVSGAISQSAAGYGFTKKTASTILSLTGTNTYTGTLTVDAGTVQIGAGAASGTLGAVVSGIDTGAASITSGATLELYRSDARTYSGTMGGAGTILRRGGSSTAAKLTGASSGFTGAVSLNAANDIIEAASAGALGNLSGGAGGGITIPSGACLQLSGGFSISDKAITVSGTGISANGAIRNISDNNTLSGSITLGFDTTIQSDADTLTLSGTSITGAYSLTFTGSGSKTVSSAIQTSAGNVTAAGGVVTLSGTSNYTGTTAVTSGTLLFRGTVSPSADGNFGNAASGIQVSESAALGHSGTSSGTLNRGIRFMGATANTTYDIVAAATSAAAAFTVGTTVALAYNTPDVAKTIRLTGTSPSTANAFQARINNNGTGAVSVTCNPTSTDTATWRLTNTLNGYSGTTAVPNGGAGSAGACLVLSVGTTATSWASGASVTGASTVVVNSGGGTTTPGKIRTRSGTLTNVNAQRGRHTYTNLTFGPNGRIRIGGA